MITAERISLVRLRLKATLRLAPSGYLFDGATGDSYTLNLASQCIVQALLDGKEPARLWCELVAAFDVSERRARRDVRSFLAQLRQLRLLTEESNGES